MDSVLETLQTYFPVLNVCCARRKPSNLGSGNAPEARQYAPSDSFQQGSSKRAPDQNEDEEEEEEEEDDGLWGGWGGESSSSQVEKKSQPAPKIIDTMGDDSDSEFEDATPPVQAKKPVLGKPSIGVPSANVPKPAAPMASVAKPVITLATAKPVILTKKEEVAPVNDDDLFGELNMAPVFKAPVVVSAEPAGWPKKDVGSSKLLSAAEDAEDNWDDA
eukprot:TRINITY_DN2129_c0_g1_i3.p1 TRINITY_DN2129_c0_g1~~TRINITY_DN2129_c0_g1_i3.p1  ORF type:complete len:218 (-),score=57.40 TRINITY_DN2129_c0_g1_i3:453-1106(-)